MLFRSIYVLTVCCFWCIYWSLQRPYGKTVAASGGFGCSGSGFVRGCALSSPFNFGTINIQVSVGMSLVVSW